MLNEQLKKELQEIILQDFGKDLSIMEINAIGQDLVNLFELLADDDNEQTNK